MERNQMDLASLRPIINEIDTRNQLIKFGFRLADEDKKSTVLLI